jgi:hypothetical protein
MLFEQKRQRAPALPVSRLELSNRSDGDWTVQFFSAETCMLASAWRGPIDPPGKEARSLLSSLLFTDPRPPPCRFRAIVWGSGWMARTCGELGTMAASQSFQFQSTRLELHQTTR